MHRGHIHVTKRKRQNFCRRKFPFAKPCRLLNSIKVGCRLFAIFFFCQLCKEREFLHHIPIACGAVGNHAVTAILNPRFRIFEAAPAAVPKRVKRAIAKQAVKLLKIFYMVAREKFTILMAEELILFLFLRLAHRTPSLILSRNISIDLGIILCTGSEIAPQYVIKCSFRSSHVSG